MVTMPVIASVITAVVVGITITIIMLIMQGGGGFLCSDDGPAASDPEFSLMFMIMDIKCVYVHYAGR
jgi:hypothetical protein